MEEECSKSIEIEQIEQIEQMEQIDNIQITELKKNYAFDPDKLKQKFSKNSIKFMTECRTKLKLYQLFNFKLKYAGIIPIDVPLFYSVNPQLTSNFPNYFNDIINFDFSSSQEITISNFLNEDHFKNIPYIRDYFCYSTFPTLFGNFIAEEYFEEGYNFIKKNFKDEQILPYLISSFLNHSMLFQDRLISTFISQMIEYQLNNKNAESNENEIAPNWPFEGISIQESLEIFMESFKQSISYMSQYQIQIIEDLWRSNPNLALYVISELFLKDILQSLSKHHSLSEYTNILTTDCSLSNPPNTAYIIRYNILSGLYNYIDFQKVIQMICDSTAYFEFGRIKNELVFYECANRIFSVSDAKIIELFGYYIKKKANKSGSLLKMMPEKPKLYFSGGISMCEPFKLKDFTKESFLIFLKDNENFQGDEIPKLKSIIKDELKMCREARIVHQFLTAHSGNLNKLQMYTEATKEIVNSKICEYISQILLKQQFFKPSEFENEVIIKASLARFEALVHKKEKKTKGSLSIDKAEEYIRELVKTKKDRYNPIDLNVFISDIFAETTKYFNKCFSQKKDVLDGKPKLQYEVINDDVFIQYLAEVSYRLRIINLNKKVLEIVQKRFNFDFKDNKKNNKLEEIILINTKKINQNDYEECFDDRPNEEKCVEFDPVNYAEIRSIILSSNFAMKKDCEFMRSQYNIRNYIQTFMIIEKMIEISIKKFEFLSDPKNKRFIFYKIFNYNLKDFIRERVYIGEGNDQANMENDENERYEQEKSCFYFRANIIRTRYFLKQILEEEKNNLLMQTKLQEAYDTISKLNEYFNLGDTIAI